MLFFNKNKKATPTSEHLEGGELPWGWVTRNKEFCDKIQNEYTYFLNIWVNTKDPKEKQSALKSFIIYLEDVEKLCQSKGECHEFWFRKILTSKGYILERKKELEELTINLDHYQKEYEKNIEIEKKTIEMKCDVIALLKENDGILQSDFWKLFDDAICKAAASNIVYDLFREGKIEKTKSGRSFILHYKE